ncbi:MAG TPA: hypothetical protein PLO37_08750 [Candidatus Hydrogenedentes bacterium]|mgnify:CR=1 FL=1|nr:hypothetical protein [Candidatus Hydrogenedentota bacterium]HPG66922.1 hypothetical protein [Candidatus Hydrogenedentota bacterium]
MAFGVGYVFSSPATGRLTGFETAPTSRFGLANGTRAEDGQLQTATEAFRQRQEETLRVGFGDGTVSNMTAAARALDKGVEAAERVVPTYQEIQAELKERRAAQAEAVRNEPFRQYERRRLEVSTQARSFINRLNEVAGTAQTRLRGEEEWAPENAPRITVDGETFAFGATFDMLA